MTDLRHLLAIYVHAHQTGNSVPPHIDAEARAALAQPGAQGPELTDEKLREMWLSKEWFNEGATLREFASIVRRWSRPAVEPVPVSDRPWEREGWCDPVGKCWWWNPATNTLGTPWWSYEPWEWVEDAAYSLPHWALPVPLT